MNTNKAKIFTRYIRNKVPSLQSWKIELQDALLISEDSFLKLGSSNVHCYKNGYLILKRQINLMMI